MRFGLASSILASLVLTAAFAAAAPPSRSATPRIAVAVRAEIPAQSERPAAAPTSRAATARTFVKSGGVAPNGGQWFKDGSGTDWLGKPTKGDEDGDRVGNEQAVGGIYRLAESAFGTLAAEVCSAKIEGKDFVLSKRIALFDGRAITDEQLKRFGEGFVLDAWLANWDAGGAWQLGIDLSGHPVRLGAGAGGLYRARGEAKGSAFADEVTELRSMRDPLRPTSFAFRKLTDRDVKQQLQKFATWYPAHRAEVDAAIDASSLRPAAATALKAKLATRAEWLLAQASKK